jgi:hypothetical protein
MGGRPRQAEYSCLGIPDSCSSPPGDSRVVGGNRNYKMGLANFRDNIFWILRSRRRIARFLPRLFQETRFLWHQGIRCSTHVSRVLCVCGNCIPDCFASLPNSSHPHRLHTQPSMIHIQVDTTSDADLENGVSAADTKLSGFAAPKAEMPQKIEFPGEQDNTRDDASDASIEFGGVYISRLSSPMDRFPGCDKV